MCTSLDVPTLRLIFFAKKLFKNSYKFILAKKHSKISPHCNTKGERARNFFLNVWFKDVNKIKKIPWDWHKFMKYPKKRAVIFFFSIGAFPQKKERGGKFDL